MKLSCCCTGANAGSVGTWDCRAVTCDWIDAACCASSCSCCLCCCCWVCQRCMRGRQRKQRSPAGTSDTVQTPPADPSSAEPPVAAGLPIGEVVPGDASVAPLRDRNT